MKALWPALLAVYMLFIAAVPLKPRELGWYAADAGVPMHAVASVSPPPVLNQNTSTRWPRGLRTDAGPERSAPALGAVLIMLLPFVGGAWWAGALAEPWRYLRLIS